MATNGVLCACKAGLARLLGKHAAALAQLSVLNHAVAVQVHPVQQLHHLDVVQPQLEHVHSVVQLGWRDGPVPVLPASHMHAAHHTTHLVHLLEEVDEAQLACGDVLLNDFHGILQVGVHQRERPLQNLLAPYQCLHAPPAINQCRSL